MGDELDPFTAGQPLPPELSHKRILILMAGVIAAGAIAGFAFVSPQFGGGVLIGGLLSFANYFWQRNSTRAVFEQAAAGLPPTLLAMRYILRYVVLGLIVAGFYFLGVVSVPAIILGLASFAFAVVIEGIIGIFSSSFSKGT